MGASRTLLRKTTADQARRAKSPPVARGTFARSLRNVRQPTAARPYEVDLHVTKGVRTRRIWTA